MLRDYLPRQTYAVVGTYREGALLVAVAAAQIDDDDRIVLQTPNPHRFVEGDSVVVHLDNRLQVTRYTPELKVYRTSVKAMVVDATEFGLVVTAQQYQVFYSRNSVETFEAPDFSWPEDNRPLRALPVSDLTTLPADWEAESGAHLGILITKGLIRPHSTVMAYLAAQSGDLFLITDPSSRKGQNLVRDPQGVFAADFRSQYDLSKPVDWAYRICSVRVTVVPRNRPVFERVRDRFLQKNPWEGAFWADPSSVLLHLVPQ